jgi:hypothetical protein
LRTYYSLFATRYSLFPQPHVREFPLGLPAAAAGLRRTAALFEAIIEFSSLTLLVGYMTDNVIRRAHQRLDAIAVNRLFVAGTDLLGRTDGSRSGRRKQHHEQATKRSGAVAFRCCKAR